MDIMYLIIGIMLLTLGRKLFWLFVGLVGFVAGMQIAQLHLMFEPHWVILVVGAACGLLGLLMALFFQNLAIGIGGFAAGSAIASQLMVILGFKPVYWIALCGGIMGLILFFLIFDWALVVLSSIAGSALIVQIFTLSSPLSAVLFIGLIVAGIIFQSVLWRARVLKRRNRTPGA